MKNGITGHVGDACAKSRWVLWYRSGDIPLLKELGTTMDFIEHIDPVRLKTLTPIAESDQFAIYAQGEDAYLLVQRHAGTPWTGVRFSGDGLFRVGALVVDAMRHLYRDVASHLSPLHRP